MELKKSEKLRLLLHKLWSADVPYEWFSVAETEKMAGANRSSLDSPAIISEVYITSTIYYPNRKDAEMWAIYNHSEDTFKIQWRDLCNPAPVSLEDVFQAFYQCECVKNAKHREIEYLKMFEIQQFAYNLGVPNELKLNKNKHCTLYVPSSNEDEEIFRLWVDYKNPNDFYIIEQGVLGIGCAHSVEEVKSCLINYKDTYIKTKTEN
jgi:hypothetical protein